MDLKGQCWEQWSRAFASTPQLPGVPQSRPEVTKLFKSKSGISSRSSASTGVQGHGSPFWATYRGLMRQSVRTVALGLLGSANGK